MIKFFSLKKTLAFFFFYTEMKQSQKVIVEETLQTFSLQPPQPCIRKPMSRMQCFTGFSVISTLLFSFFFQETTWQESQEGPVKHPKCLRLPPCGDSGHWEVVSKKSPGKKGPALAVADVGLALESRSWGQKV